MSNSLMTLYAIRRRDGQFFASKKRGGDWTSELGKARIYTKPGPARSMITFFANIGRMGISELVELRVTEVVGVVETERVQKSVDRKAKMKVAQKARDTQWQRELAISQLKAAQETLKRLGKKL